MEILRIKELGDIFTGKTPPTANPKNFGNVYPFVTPVDLKDAKFIDDTERYVSETGIKHTTLIPANSICVTCIGSTIGKLGITIKNSSTNQQINTIIVNDNFNTDYVYYLLLYNVPYFKELAGVNALPQLNKSDFSKVKLLGTKNKHEQTAIATILSKVDEAIEATRQSIKSAEKLKKALMQNLLIGKLKPDGTWRSDDEFYEDEKFGKVPNEWEVKAVNEIVERKNDTIDLVKSKEIFDYVGLEHIAQGEFIRIGKGKSNETLAIKVAFNKGDLLYGKLRPYLNKVWLADISGVGSTEFLVFGKNKFIDWVYLNFQTKRFLDFTLSMTAGTQHPRASWRDVKRHLIIKPINIDELDAISTKILATEKDKKAKQTKIQTLQRLKKSLMQNLLTGKVRVNPSIINDKLLMVNENERNHGK